MTPKQFAIVLDEWSTKGGALPESIPHDYAITTAEEANAVCRALPSNHIYAVGSIKTPALDKLLAFLQSVETQVCVRQVRALPDSGRHAANNAD
jgi:hypothetical protein